MRGRTRTVVAAVVVGLHGIAGWVAATYRIGEVRVARPEPIVARLLFALESPTPESAADRSEPERQVLTPPATPPQDGAVTPTAYALATVAGQVATRPSLPAAADGSVEVDGRVLRELCATAYPATAAELRPESALTLIARIDVSGRPLDVRVVGSSADPAIDNAISNCVLAKGAFPAGRPTGAGERWVRIDWPAS